MNNIRNDTRVPVTVLTGFLGSGKTTLLNRMLTAEHGKRIAVIENEFGEVGIDQALVVRSDEEIFEMNNGCICCTVRGDLIRILSNLIKRRNKFDYILIETTGLADPGPVAQTFSMDDELKPQCRLDGVVTLVDAKHVIQHIDDSEEVQKQIAFADVILLNKIDLVSESELDELEARVKRMNAHAKVYRTCQGELPLDHVLHVGGFNLERALEVDPRFLEPEYPFEWGGIISLPAGEHALGFEPGPDPSMQVAFFPATGAAQAALDIAREQAVLIFSDRDQGARYLSVERRAECAGQPDSSVLASGGQDARVRCWEPGKDDPVTTYPAGGDWVEKAAWSPDGTQLAWCAGRNMCMVDMSSGKITIHEAHPATVHDLHWSPGDKLRLAWRIHNSVGAGKNRPLHFCSASPFRRSGPPLVARRTAPSRRLRKW